MEDIFEIIYKTSRPAIKSEIYLNSDSKKINLSDEEKSISRFSAASTVLVESEATSSSPKISTEIKSQIESRNYNKIFRNPSTLKFSLLDIVLESREYSKPNSVRISEVNLIPDPDNGMITTETNPIAIPSLKSSVETSYSFMETFTINPKPIAIPSLKHEVGTSYSFMETLSNAGMIATETKPMVRFVYLGVI